MLRDNNSHLYHETALHRLDNVIRLVPGDELAPKANSNIEGMAPSSDTVSTWGIPRVCHTGATSQDLCTTPILCLVKIQIYSQVQGLGGHDVSFNLCQSLFEFLL